MAKLLQQPLSRSIGCQPNGGTALCDIPQQAARTAQKETATSGAKTLEISGLVLRQWYMRLTVSTPSNAAELARQGPKPLYTSHTSQMTFFMMNLTRN